MRIASLAILVACIGLSVSPASAQGVPAIDISTADATLFYPRTVARAEERSYDGNAVWQLVDLGPTKGLEAIVTFPGTAADMIVLIEENPYSDLPDDILIHAWPQWQASADGPAVASAYIVGVETADGTQVGLIGTARGDWTLGLMAAAAERNHARLETARTLIIELGLPDGKAYVGLRLGEEQHRLLADIVPADEPAFPLSAPAEQRILGANAPDGTGGVLWDTPASGGGPTVRGRVYLYESGTGFELSFTPVGDGFAVAVSPGTEAAAGLGRLIGVSVLTADGSQALVGETTAHETDDSSGLTFAGAAAASALSLLRSGAALALDFMGASGAVSAVLVAIPQRWDPFALLDTAR